MTLPDIEDVGAQLHDARWAGWAARLEVKRLADDPKTADRRWRTAVRVAMPSWFPSLYAVYIDELPAFAAATLARQTKADQNAAAAETLRADGMKIEDVAEELDRHPTTIARYPRRKRADPSIS